MAYIRTEQVAEMRKQIKELFPECKFGIRRSSSKSTIEISLMSSPYTYDELFDVNKRIKKLTIYELGFAGNDYNTAEEKASIGSRHAGMRVLWILLRNLIRLASK